jgi:predicted  nucleic acid-binding Zn-ribbon protein
MTSLEQVKKLVEMQNLYNREKEIKDLYKEQEARLIKAERENDNLVQTRGDIELTIKEMDKKINEELGKRDEINTRITSLDEGKDKIKIVRQIKSWEKEMEKMQQEQSLIQAQIEYDTSKQLEYKNEQERLSMKIEENKVRIGDFQKEIDVIKEQHSGELNEIISKSGEIRKTFGIQFIDYFDSMLHKTAGAAIVLVEGDACSGCNTILPTALQGDLGADIRPEDIDMHQCPHCFRYLYFEEWMELVEEEIY